MGLRWNSGSAVKAKEPPLQIVADFSLFVQKKKEAPNKEAHSAPVRNGIGPTESDTRMYGTGDRRICPMEYRRKS